MELRLRNESEVFSPEGIAKVEEMKNAKFVCDGCVKGADGGWRNHAVAIFWNKDPANVPDGGSRWFGLYTVPAPDGGDHRIYICNAESAAGIDMTGMAAVNGDVIYSRYRHDYRVSEDGTAMIDGGRDYVRTGPIGLGAVTLRIEGPDLVIVSDELLDGVMRKLGAPAEACP